MAGWIDVARVAVSLNILLLPALLSVWGRNYLDIRSKHTLGLLVFGVLLLGENVSGLYFYWLDPVRSVWFRNNMATPAWQATVLLHVLEAIALAVLAWVTWD